MIAIRIEGRLGNQLFQYAFIYAAARRLNTAFYLDKSAGDFLLPQYFEVKTDFPAPLDKRVFSLKGYKNIFSFYARRAFYSALRNLLLWGKTISIGNDTPVKDSLKRVKNNCFYEGFFHSEGYFEDFKHEIRAMYTIHKKYVDAFELVRKKLDASKRKVVVHVRRNDYVGLDISLPLSYYKKAIGMIDGRDIQYVFISDDPAYIEAEFNYLGDKYISAHDEITDLQLMMSADICILSCSSFSWWGAWLNNNTGKQVYAPKYWLGFKEGKEFPAGIANHQDFNWINV